MKKILKMFGVINFLMILLCGSDEKENFKITNFNDIENIDFLKKLKPCSLAYKKHRYEILRKRKEKEESFNMQAEKEKISVFADKKHN